MSSIVKYVERKEPEERVCTKCTLPKPDSKYRRRHKMRNGKKEFYTMGECSDCVAKRANKYYHNNLDKCRKRGRETAKKNYSKRLAYTQQYRKNNPEWWAKYMEKYREDNKEHIAKMHKKIGKEWHKKNRDELSETYVIQKLIQGTNLKRADIEPFPELIDAHRQNIKIKRLIIQKQQ